MSKPLGPLKRLGVALYVSFCLFLLVGIVMGPTSPAEAREKVVRAQHQRAHYGLPARGIPGVTSGVGTEASLNYLLGLQEFAYIPPISATYYVSSDAGGRAGAGDDDNTGLSWAQAFRSLCAIDGIIEAATEPIHVIFDSDGGNDEWLTLATDIDCENGDYWDGSLGPPELIGSIDIPAVILSASDPSNCVDLDLLEMRDEQILQNCTGANYGGNACRIADNEGVFSGRSDPGVKTGWLAVQNFCVEHYPNDLELNSSDAIKPVVVGNVITLNVDAGTIQGDRAAFASQTGGISIHINPVVAARPPSDFYAACNTATDSALGCADADVYPDTALCSGTDVPYTGCTAAGFKTDQPLFIGGIGSLILISDQTYSFTTNGQKTGVLALDSVIHISNGSEFVALGPMKLQNGVHPDNAVPHVGGTNSIASAMKFQADHPTLGQSDSAQQWVVAFVEFDGFWGAVSAPPAGVLQIDYSGNATGMAYTLETYGLRINDLVNNAAPPGFVLNSFAFSSASC